MTRRNTQTTGKRPPRTRRRASRPTALDPYTTMVLDPCSSTLVPGLYGDSQGLLARLKTTFQSLSGSLDTCGYVLWCPDYGGVSSTGIGGNLFYWSSSSSSTVPSNTAPNLYGTAPPVPPLLTTTSILDPTSSLLGSDIVADARCLAACIEMTYFGKMLDSAGEVGYISNLPARDLLEGGAGSQPLSVDDLMRYCNNKSRFGVDTLENVYRPNIGNSDVFHTVNENLFTIGTGVTPTDVSVTAATRDPRCFGFVWRNTEPNAGIVFDFTKSIEWRPTPSSGLTQVPVRSHHGDMSVHVNTIVDNLNSALQRSGSRSSSTSMWERVKGSFQSLPQTLLKSVFTGSSTGAAQRGLKNGLDWLMKEGMGMGLSAIARQPELFLPFIP